MLYKYCDNEKCINVTKYQNDYKEKTVKKSSLPLLKKLDIFMFITVRYIAICLHV